MTANETPAHQSERAEQRLVVEEKGYRGIPRRAFLPGLLDSTWPWSHLPREHVLAKQPLFRTSCRRSRINQFLFFVFFFFFSSAAADPGTL
jgi:hypothetical protein